MKEITTIQGAWSDDANGWVSEVLELTGDAWLEVTLPAKGRLVIKKAEPPSPVRSVTKTANVFPKALITPWTGPDFRIRLYGSTKRSLIRICLTDTPKTIQYANI